MTERTTLHLASKEVWARQANGDEYFPEAYAADGFIHCTDGDDEMIVVANRYYRADTREFIVLTIDVDRLRSEMKYEDPGRIYPHIYGPLNTDAVIGVRGVERSEDGTFLRFQV